MSLAYSMSIIVKAVDQVTDPMRRINTQIRRMTDPVRAVGKSLSGLSEAAGLGQLQKALGGVAGGMKDVAGEATKLLGTMSLVGGGLAFAFKTGFVDVAAKFERFETVLTTLEGSSTKAKQSMDWISEFAATTPYELDQVMEAFIKLKAYGIDPMDGTLRQVGDAAAAMGKPLMQAVEALADAKSGEFTRLKELIGGTFKNEGGKIAYTFIDKNGMERTFAAANNDAKALQKMVLKVFEEKGYSGSMDNLSKTWEGMVSNLSDAWTRFSNMIMQAGAFDWMKETLGGLLDTINEMAANGELQALAKEFGGKLTEGLKVAWAAAKELGAAFMSFLSFLPRLASFMGGWGNVLIAVGVIIAGPLIAALASLGAAIVSLGVAIGFTPIGWFIGIVAALAALAYVIIDNWSAITGFFAGLWEGVKGAFNGFVEWVTSSPLFQIGAWLVKAWWDGMVSNWSAVVSWLQGAVSSLLDLVPDGLKARLGLDVSAKAAPPTGQSTGAGAVPPTGQPTGAGAVLDGGAAKPGGQAEQKVTTEVVIKGENLPPGMTVAAPASQADRTNIDLGYSMAGA